jgi:hypothetical protein
MWILYRHFASYPAKKPANEKKNLIKKTMIRKNPMTEELRKS